MLEAIMKRLRLNKRGVSNVIVVMLSLVLIVIVVANVVLWSYQMNQFDWERMQEKINLTNAERARDGVKLTLQNEGPVTCHIVGIWIVNSTTHKRYSADFFFNSGVETDYVRTDLALPAGSFIVKAVTERGNTAVFRKS